MPQTISPGFRKLLREPAYCQLATLMPDGSPQITQVWVRYRRRAHIDQYCRGAPEGAKCATRSARRGKCGGPGAPMAWPWSAGEW